MSHGSQDGGGYQRLRDYSDLEDALHHHHHHTHAQQQQHGYHGVPPMHRSATAEGPLAPQSAASSPGRGSGAGVHKPPPGPGAASVAGSSVSGQTASSRAMFRQKKGRKMAWLLVYNTGDSQTVNMDKRQLIQVMGLEIPMRDLRLMDPALAGWESFAQILVRDNALVVSAEYVRLIITADKVIFPLDFEKTEQSERFIKTVETIIRERPDCVRATGASPIPGAGPGSGPSGSGGGAGGVDLPLPPAAASPAASRLAHRSLSTVVASTSWFKDPELLPFELNMLEVALGEITRHYTQQTSSLEALAHPALDALMRNCNSVNLERVRKIKTQHQRLQGRLQGLREVLERYLEDDQDMYRMCLSKWREQELEGAGSDNTLLLGRPGNLLGPGGMLGGGSMPRRAANLGRSPPGFMERFQGMSRRDRGDDTSSSSSSSNSGGADYHDLLEVENLLESYTMMVDGTSAKLAGIGEYIDDTEDYINIELDYNRNRLLRIEILLTVATFALAIYNLVAGILGENLVLPDLWTHDIRGFIIINAGTLSVCVITFFAVWRIMVAKKLI